ncbi:MAG: DUF4157 domain-containing protein [Flavitalea sp.]
MTNQYDFQIRERSWLARLGAWKLGTRRMAMTIGSTIYLYNTTREEFLSDTLWVKHELTHVRQFKRYGFWNFIFRYTFESIKTGYYNNKYEVEAREAEKA